MLQSQMWLTKSPEHKDSSFTIINDIEKASNSNKLMFDILAVCCDSSRRKYLTRLRSGAKITRQNVMIGKT